MSQLVPTSQAGVSQPLHGAASKGPLPRGLTKRIAKHIERTQSDGAVQAFSAEVRHGLERQRLQHEEERGRIRIGGAAEIAMEAHHRNRSLSIEQAITEQTVPDQGRGSRINEEYVRSVAGILLDYRDRTA